MEPLLFCARPWQHVTVFHHIVWREVAEIDPNRALLHSGDFTYRLYNTKHEPLPLLAGSSGTDVSADPDLMIRRLPAEIAITRLHSETTGAPTWLVQVVIDENEQRQRRQSYA